MKAAILALIQDIAAQREQEGKAPTHATRLEIDRAVNKALNDLYQEGRITVGKTINDKWIKAND